MTLPLASGCLPARADSRSLSYRHGELRMDADSLNGAIDRFFRSYFNHCVVPDEDTLLNFLNALHSLNDKLQKEVGRNLRRLGELHLAQGTSKSVPPPHGADL